MSVQISKHELKAVATGLLAGLVCIALGVLASMVGCKPSPVLPAASAPAPRTNRPVVVFPPLPEVSRSLSVTSEAASEMRVGFAVGMTGPEGLTASSNPPPALVATPAYTARGKIRLAWDASRDTTVTGYRVYYGGQSGNYTNSANVGSVLAATITGLEEGVKYYFACHAYDASGMESIPSNEASATTEFYVAIRSRDWIVETFGRAGATNQILMTTNLVVWTVVKEFAGVAGLLTNIIEPGLATAYYRVRVK